MAGNPDDPTGEHWGGQFEPWKDGNKWIDKGRERLGAGSGGQGASQTISKWRHEFLDHLKQMMDRAKNEKLPMQ